MTSKMKLIIFLVVVGVCTADKLDRTYLPPLSAKTAGGEGTSLQAPVETFGPQRNPPQFIHSVGAKFSGGQFKQPGPGQPTSNNLEQLSGPTPYNAPSNVPSHNIGHFGPSSSSYQPPGPSRYQPSGPSPYQPSGPSPYQPSGPSQYQPSGPTHQGPERAQAQFERTAGTIRQESDVRPDGYEYSFETENGIRAQQIGHEADGINAVGDFSYTGDDGVAVMLTYEADENGYRPKGDHLPTPPPIPDAILRSLQQNAEDEANGIVDDGSYDGDKYQEPESNNNYGGSSPFGKGQQGHKYQPKQQSNPAFGKQVAGPSSFDTEEINNQKSFPSKQYIPGSQKYQNQGPLFNQYNSPKPYSSALPHQQGGPEHTGPSQTSQYSAPGFGATPQSFNKPRPNYNAPQQPQSGPYGPSQSGPYGPSQSGPYGPSQSGPSGPSQSGTQPQYNGPSQQHPQGPATLPQSQQNYPSNGPEHEAPNTVSAGYPGSSAPEKYSTQGTPNQQYNARAKPFGAQHQASPDHQQNSPQQEFSGQQYNSQNIPQNSQSPYRPSQNYGPSAQLSSNQHPGEREQFGGPRQPPSFSPEKGYKY